MLDVYVDGFFRYSNSNETGVEERIMVNFLDADIPDRLITTMVSLAEYGKLVSVEGRVWVNKTGTICYLFDNHQYLSDLLNGV